MVGGAAEGARKGKIKLGRDVLLYALSTLAQTCAALVAFIGALGLYRLQSIRGNIHEMYRNLRGLLASVGKAEWRPEVLAILPDRKVREIANQVIAHPENPQQEQIQDSLREEVGRRETLGRDLRRTQRLVIVFGGLNLMAILISLLGFNFLSYLEESLLFSVLYGILAFLVVLVVVAMVFELTGSLPDKLTCHKAGQVFLEWLQREYRGSKQSEKGGE